MRIAGMSGRLRCVAPLLAALCWACGAAQAASDGPQAAADAATAGIYDLPNPPDWRSKNGVLAGTLEFEPALVTVRGRKVVANVINGS